MRAKNLALCSLLAAALVGFPARAAQHKPAEFGQVVKLIESHYGVKKLGMSLLARAGIKATQVVVSRKTRFSEYGSVKFAVFDDQDFSSPRGDFGAALRAALTPGWEPLVEVRSGVTEQVYVYTREAGKLFRVLVVTVGQRDATAVQAELAPHKLMLLIKDARDAGKVLTDEATDDAEP